MSARRRLGAVGPEHRRSLGSPGLVRGLPAALAVVGLAACEMFRPPDLDPDVVVLSLLIESGKRTARMLAQHHNRDWAEEISATLEGPGWAAEFVPTDSRERCGAVFLTCMIASLPEAAAPGRYRLRGTTPLGPFSGEATVPAIPLMENSADTVRIPSPDSGLFHIPLHYRVDSGTAALLVDRVRHRHGRPDSLGTGLWEVGDTLDAWYDGRPYALDVRVRGIGPNFTDWFRHTDNELVLPPWPSFGIEGEGVYGYFDGISAPAPWVHIVVGEP